MSNQRTIKKSVVFEGTGLHTGESTKIELLPAQAGTGIIFVRKDNAASTIIKADFYSMLDPRKYPRRTSVGSGAVHIYTIEHLMAALHILGVDNIQVNVWGNEIPGLDGSAKPFVEGIREAGLTDFEAPKDTLHIKEPLWVKDVSSSIVVLPSDELRFSYALCYDHPFVATGFAETVINATMEDKFYESRTFCLEEEAKPLLESGLGKGSNYENTLVVSRTGIVKNKLRFPDELVKHKVLDLVGDLYLAGPFVGHVIATRSGHSLNMRLLEKLRRLRERTVGSGVGSATGFVPQQAELNAQEIMKILPHRYPFLLVDRIIAIEKGARAVGIKNVTMNEEFFQGHFPGRPVMPGVLIIEAMAQVGGVLMLACEEHKGKLAFFMAANNVKFRKTVEPGDQLVLEVKVGKVKSRTGTVHTTAHVAGKLVAEGELMFALVEM